jgi:cation diffusion facilitator family transporter
MDRPPPQTTASQEDRARGRGIQRTTLVAVVTNAALATGQLAVGIFANAFSLVADAVHTLSDLLTDLLVLLAGRHGAHPADRDHPYGHARIETAAALLLAVVLTGVGLGFLWASGVRLQHMDTVPPLHHAAIYMAILTLVAKEGLFRYTLAASRRLNAPLLEANAWHARSDAASSLVVAAGIGGSLAGFPFLEPLAAAVVGFLIVNMGVRLAWRSVRELIDTGLSDEDVARLHRTIRETPGVIGLHGLRTRRMADRVLCDTHVQVDPRITVSEGHRISDAVSLRIRAAHPQVRDVLVHIDAENDGVTLAPPPGGSPERTEVLRTIRSLLDDETVEPLRVQLHYLGDRVEVEAILPHSAWPRVKPDVLRERVAEVLRTNPQYRSITFFVQAAP